MKKVFLFIVTACIVASCTLTEKVVFDSKGGGEMSYELDGTDFVNFMESMDSTGNGYNFSDSLDAYLAAMQGLKNVKGVHHVKITPEAKKISVSFSFDNIEALNKAHIEMGVQSELLRPGMKYNKVEMKNKKEWTYHTIPLGASADDSSYSMLGMMLTHKVDVTFPSAVKSTNSKAIQINGKQITWASSVENPGASYAFDGITVKMK